MVNYVRTQYQLQPAESLLVIYSKFVNLLVKK